ncbi:MAG TPA: PucR family transcriptional regulator ligand-binding domain-containing protein, partial [Syntrophomonadaceae bacterium]|nr:PucR family transcriptional regulator ligand-binding domain-containing protein [Syntrophomonadaceae bacterium]
MKLILSDLYYLYKEKYHFSLVAGNEGLTGNLAWVYVSEDILTTNFLRGGELVVTTGLSANQDKDWLYKFVKALISRQCCGLIINTGNYISPKNISDDVIEHCNRYNFPLITMPWDVHISDVMNDYYNEIFIRNY